MRECTFISNFRGPGAKLALSLLWLSITPLLLMGGSAWADADSQPDPPLYDLRSSPFHLLAQAGSPGGATSSSGPAKDRALPSDPDEFSPNPFTDYGEFNNQDQQEEDDTKFLQFGHLFGVSLYVGQDLPLGNRGELWQGGFPLVMGELHYWFDFHLVMDLGVSWAPHYFTSNADGEGYTTVSLVHVYVNLRYYFDTKNLSAPISFASPYVLIGFGDFAKTQSYQGTSQSDSDSEVGVTGGVGLEFPISINSVYFDLEATISAVTFQDTQANPYNNGPSTLSGPLTTFTGGLMFTW
jgi:hypothetical protein